ncbi:MAG: hypothetical protein OEY38_19445 [Gammaproteobacteria bacterium]|nr:hypothetical protein [Gammaproteobacteria bacterium]
MKSVKLINRMLLLFVMFIACSSVEVVAAEQTAGKITEVVTFLSGDVLLRMDTPVEGCDAGYWFSKSDAAGYEGFLSSIFSAYHAKSNIRLWGDDTKYWSGDSTNKYCKLGWLVLAK